MNALFNSALRQSTALRKDLDLFADTATPSPSLQGQLSASLTSLARTIDDYAKLANQEPVQTKQEKAFERLRTFRGELDGYRASFKQIKEANEDVQTTAARTELLGRRPHHAATPENPYSQPNIAASSAAAGNSAFAPSRSYAPSQANPYSAGAANAPADYNREAHAFREASFFTQTSTQLDEFLDRGRAVLGDLGDQRDMLKGTQKRLYNVANTLGISGDTIRMVERRAKQDKWIFGAGVVVFFLFCWLVIHYLR